MDEASAPGETGPPNVSRVGRSDTEDRDHEGLERVSGGGGEGVGPETLHANGAHLS